MTELLAEPAHDLDAHVTALLAAQSLHFEALAVENDRRYEERFRATDRLFTQALAAQKELIAAIQLAADKAVGKAEAANEKRFDGVNEFRAALTDQTAHFMPRPEVESRFSAMSEKLNTAIQRAAVDDGRVKGMASAWAVFLAVAGLTIGVGGVILSILR